MGLYESGFNNANDPDGILKWQRAIAGISGSTRRDYVTSIALDQEQRIYLCGYTDTNSVDPDDMWIIQCGIEGDLVEKRKVASQDDSEKMHQIMMISDDRFFFIGVNDQNDDLIFGEFFYDGANIEMDWIKQIPTVGGRVVNPTMTMDDYGAVIVAWDIFNSAASRNATRLTLVNSFFLLHRRSGNGVRQLQLLAISLKCIMLAFLMTSGVTILLFQMLLRHKIRDIQLSLI